MAVELDTDGNKAIDINLGGTNAKTAGEALSNLGGQPYDADLDILSSGSFSQKRALIEAFAKPVLGVDALRTTMADFDGDCRYLAYHTASGDGGHGTFVWSTADLSAEVTADPLHGIYVAPTSDPTGASGAWVRQLNGADYDIRWYGAREDTDVSIQLKAACKHSNGGRVLIPFRRATVPGNPGAWTNCYGAEVVGTNTLLTGMLGNYSRMVGFIREDGDSLEKSANYVNIVKDRTTKLILKNTDNKYTVFVETSSGLYAEINLINNITTTTASLATTTSDITAWRVNFIQTAFEILTGYTAYSAISGSWSPTYVPGAALGFPTGGGTTYVYDKATTTGAYKDFDVVVPRDGFFSVGFVRDNTTSENVSVSVDGIDVATGVNTRNGLGNDVYILDLKTSPGPHTIRVTNNDTTYTALRLLGINVNYLKNQRSDVTLDTYSIYRNTTEYPPALNANSENKMALSEMISGKWGGGYHGGETGIVSHFMLDGVSVNLAVGDFTVCSTLEIQQEYTLDWSAFGGGAVDCISNHIFKAGGYATDLTLTGDLTVYVGYTTLFGVSDNFSEVVFPVYVDKSLLDYGRLYLPKGNRVVFRCPTSGQKFTINYTTYNGDADSSNDYGTFVNVADYYHKFYNTYFSGSGTIKNLAVINEFILE